MAKVNAEIADRMAAQIKDNRSEPGWEEALWEKLQWLDDLDTKQVDILFDMVVSRWNAALAKAGVK